MANNFLLRPIVDGWLAKLAHARDAKKAFTSVAKQCESFFSADMGFMWKDEYKQKFLSGNLQSKFHLTIAKAFELVAIFGPVLFWKYPNRIIKNYEPIELVPEVFGDVNDPQVQQMFQMAMQEQQQDQSIGKVRNSLMEKYLNYSQREQPYGGLAGQAELAITEALVKGRGCLHVKPYSFPGSGRTLTGAFFLSVDDFFVDPDCRNPDLSDAEWISIRHVMPRWRVEQMFNLPKDYLKGKAHLESAASQAENRSYRDQMYRQTGKTNDLVVWHEFFSKTGVGGRLKDVISGLTEDFDRVVGDYARLCVMQGVDHPLNLTPDMVMGFEDEVKQALEWPVPTWMDNRWPVAILDFYRKPGCAWPIAPLAPGLGELTFMNVMMSLLCNRAWSSSRDIVAYLKSYASNIEEQLKSGDFQCFIELNDNLNKNIQEIIQFVQQPGVNRDVFTMLEAVSSMFDRRVGLTELAYGLNPGGVASRSAADIQAKQESLSVRPDYMAGKVEDWMTEIATVEKFTARWHVMGKDVEPLLGKWGGVLWDQLITSEDPEICVREMKATVEAGSARKSNRQRDAANLNQALGWMLPVLQQYSMLTGDSGPVNAFFAKWGEAADMDMSGMEMGEWKQQPPEPTPEMEQQQQMAMQQQQAAIEAEQQLKYLDIQSKTVDLQQKMQALQGGGVDPLEGEKQAQELEFDQIKKNQELTYRDQLHQLDLDAKQTDAIIKLQLARDMAMEKVNAQGK